jgi:hypothetical protein
MALAMSPPLLATLVAYEKPFGIGFPSGSSSLVGRMSIVAYLIAVPPLALLRKLGITSPHENDWVDALIMLAFVMLIVIIAALALTYLVIALAWYVSAALSVVLNRLTWKQIRRVGFGNDTLGEVAINANSISPWMGSNWLPLPDQLSEEISALSNNAASVAVSKFRSLITQLALSQEKEMKSFFFSEYLTWDELIHTSYFSVPHFRMLVAYAIANSEGFRPSAAFKNDPDYNLVAGWYEEIKPKAEPARA